MYGGTQATQADVNTECLVYGKVIKVTDGDTVKVLDADHVTHKIRLAGIDAPERKQPFGKASGKYLAKLVNQQMVCIQGDKTDKYGRTVGVILLNDLDINLELVTAGYAWHYKKYQNEQSKLDRKFYSDAEEAAQTATIGLWSIPNPIPPADWRDGIRDYSEIGKIPEPYTCGSKRFCKQMEDCAEAYFYLQQCDLKRLDGNSDGIPCSKLCSKLCSSQCTN